MEGVKHLVKCRCILPTYKHVKNPPTHSFVVFSVIDDDGNILEKKAQCNNCGIVHSVTGMCQSTILKDEELSNILTIEDVKLNLPPDVRDILGSYDCDIATYENVQFLLALEKKDGFVILSSEEKSGSRIGKLLRYKGSGRFSVEPFEDKLFFK